MDGWNTILSYWVSVTFQGRAVKLREGKDFKVILELKIPGTKWWLHGLFKANTQPLKFYRAAFVLSYCISYPKNGANFVRH